MVLRGVNKQTKGKNKMKKFGEGLTLQEFLKSLGLDDPDIRQEREPAKIAPSGNEPMPTSEMSDIASAKIAPSEKEPLPKSELAKIKPSKDQNKINQSSKDQPSKDQPSATKPKVINNDVDNSADTVPNVNINNNNNINILRQLRINNISLDPARARVRVRDNVPNIKWVRQWCYKYTPEMEYVRECQWRNTSQGKFESSMLSLDALVASFDKPDHIAVFSDRGAGVEQIAAHDDERERERRIAAALSLLSSSDRRFAEEILRGKSWRDLGYRYHPAFYRRLDRLIQKVRKNGNFGKLW